MASCNSSYKIGCVEPEGFQQLKADRFLQKEIPILQSHPLSAFSKLVSLVLMLLFCYTIKQKKTKNKKNMANVLVVSRPDSCF